MFGLFLPAGSAALGIASHMNRIVTGSFIFFGISVALFGVVRATGAVMAPLAILTVSLLLVRFPLAEAVPRPVPGGCGLVELPDLLGVSAVLAMLYYKFGGWRTGAHGRGSRRRRCRRA